jgi:multidrug efflux pump subunit AcrA (membrane-fusion protein)
MPDEIDNASENRGGGGSKGVIIFIALLIVALGGLFALGLLPRLEREQDLKKAHEETVGAVPVVHTVVAQPAQHTESITLPGNIGAIQYTTIYARVDGYLSERLVDIGDEVKKGQLIAQIDTPTIDDALLQAKADLLKAKAGYETSEAN